MRAVKNQTFDRHKFVKEFKKVGFNEDQAEVIVNSIAISRDFDLSKLTTKEQLDNAQSNLTKEIESVRTDLTKEIESLRSEVKKEIETLRSEVKKDIEACKLELRVEMHSLANTIIKWNVATIIAAVGIMITVMKLMQQ